MTQELSQPKRAVHSYAPIGYRKLSLHQAEIANAHLRHVAAKFRGLLVRLSGPPTNSAMSPFHGLHDYK
jgi:hypothetical protein